MSAPVADVKNFWDANPCNSRLSTRDDRKEYFSEIEQKRYRAEWHIPIVAKFDQYRDREVLEIGCGIGTDGLQFARHGARYTGVDLTPTAIKISRERFELFDAHGQFEVANAEALPFPDESFDHVYSFGVIHHSPNTETIVREMHRVLRPGGTFCIMVYNKASINYYVEIMFLRKLFRLVLYPSFMPSLIAKLTGLDEWKLRAHREIMLNKGTMSKQDWLSINTDGPHCPLAKVYAKQQALDLFSDFEDVKTEVWHFDKSHWPLIGHVLPASVVKFLGRHWGWHRMVYGRKS